MTERRAANPYRVLLIEDSRAMVRLLREALRYSFRPFDVVDVGTVDEATDYLREHEPDAVVLDLGLPDAVGLSGLSAVRKVAPDIPVVVLTGNSADDDIALNVLRAGAQDFMSKVDDDWEQLPRAVAYAIERHGALQELRKATAELTAANEQLEEQARRDHLTGLLNRRGLAETLPKILAAAERDRTVVFALMADLDDFRKINDRHGYSVGDIFMREIANRLRENLRPGDYAGRLGGDELMVLMAVEQEAQAWQASERIRLAIAEDIMVLRGSRVRVTASLALVRLDMHHTLLDRVMASAGEALKISKRLGKDRVSGPTPSGRDASARGRAIEALTDPSCYRQISHDIARLADGEIVGQELVTRFSHPAYERPEMFLALAAEANLLTTVDHLCLVGGLAHVASIDAGRRVHLNLLPATLLSLSTGHLDELMSEIDPRRVCIEVDEQQVGDPAAMVGQVEHLRTLGAGFGLDDVGGGLSSLESLVLLQPSTITLDPRATAGAATDPSRRVTLERLLAVLRTTDAEVIAQGVATEAEAEFLASVGVTHAQGPLWGSELAAS